MRCKLYILQLILINIYNYTVKNKILILTFLPVLEKSTIVFKLKLIFYF